MYIHTKKMISDDEIYWVFFEHGSFSKPIMIINDYNFMELIQKRQKLQEE